MIISLVITVILLYIAFNTNIDGQMLPYWVIICMVAISLASWQSAIVMFIIALVTLYKGIKNKEINTLDWIEDLVND